MEDEEYDVVAEAMRYEREAYDESSDEEEEPAFVFESQFTCYPSVFIGYRDTPLKADQIVLPTSCLRTLSMQILAYVLLHAVR